MKTLPIFINGRLQAASPHAWKMQKEGSSTKLFCIQKVVKPKANEPRKYLLIHKEAVRESRKGSGADSRRLLPDWTIGPGAGILIAPWGHL
jgi:hypothetical protein